MAWAETPRLTKGHLLVRRFFTSLFILILLAALGLFGGALWWLHEPLQLRLQPGSQLVDLEIETGTSAEIGRAFV